MISTSFEPPHEGKHLSNLTKSTLLFLALDSILVAVNYFIFLRLGMTQIQIVAIHHELHHPADHPLTGLSP